MKKIIVSAMLTSVLLSACGSKDPVPEKNATPVTENKNASPAPPSVQSSTVIATPPANAKSAEPVPIDLQEPLLSLKRTVFTMRELEAGKNWKDASVSANIVNDCKDKEMVVVESLLTDYKKNIGENQLRERVKSSIVSLAGADPTTLPYQFTDKYFDRVVQKIVVVPSSDLSNEKEGKLKDEFLSDCALMKTSRVMYSYMNNVDLLHYLSNNPSVVQELGLTMNTEAVNQLLSSRLSEERMRMKQEIMTSGRPQ